MLRVESPLPAELEALTKKVIGAAIEVHRTLGPGFVECIYETALCHELVLIGVPFEKQKSICVRYKNIEIPGQRLDMVVAGKLLLELKSIDEFAAIHKAQMVSYLRATGLRVGLLINFKEFQLKDGIKRVVL